MVAGRIESGTLGVGDKLIVQPGGVSASVKKVNREDVSVPVAFAGDYILATLGGITSEHLQ
jgi:translation elongation factor EF-1alpha